MTKQSRLLFSIPYFIWLLLFVVTPLGMIFYKSFFDINGQVTLGNYTNYFASGNYLEMTFNSVWYAFLVTLVTLLVSYPTALFLSRSKHKQLWLLLIILPTWGNLLLFSNFILIRLLFYGLL